MIIKTELFQDKAYILDDSGNVWRVTIAFDEGPLIHLVSRIERWQIEGIMRPQLPQYDKFS